MKPRPTFSVSVKLWLHSDIYVCLGSFYLVPQDVKSLILGAIWNFSKGTRLPWTDVGIWGKKDPL